MKTNLLLLALLFSVSTIFAQFNWEHTNGPEGGGVTNIHNTNDYAFFCDENFLYRSADGESWEKLPEHSLWPIATYNNTLAARFVVEEFINYNPTTSFKYSPDNGNTWESHPLPEEIKRFNKIAMCGHGIYVATHENTLYRSPDNGQSWELVTPFGQYIQQLHCYDDRFYISTETGFWRTDVNGENRSLIPLPAQVNTIHNFFVTGSHILIPQGVSTIWYSHDEGLTWNSAEVGIGGNNGFDNFSFDGNTIYAEGGETLTYSNDFGESWTPVSTTGTAAHGNISIANVDGKLLCSTFNKGVARFNQNTQTFVDANEGLHSAVIHRFAYDGDNNLYVGNGTGIHRFDEVQQEWANENTITFPLNYYDMVAVGENGLLMAAEIYSNQLYRSIDYGQTWSSMPTPPSPISIKHLQIIGSDTYLYTNTEIYISQSFGQAWTLLSNAPSRIAPIIEKDGLLYLATLNKIYTSSDKGFNWTLLTQIDFTNNLGYFTKADDYLMLIAFVTVNGQLNKLLYKSLDGINWEYAHDGIPKIEHISFQNVTPNDLFFKENNNYYTTVVGYGIWVSADSMNTWIPVDYRYLGHYKKAGNVLYSGRYGGGVLQATIPDFYSSLVSGTIYWDENNNGLKENNEQLLSNIPVSLYAPNSLFPFYYSYSNQDGSYQLSLTAGASDTLRPIPTHKYVEAINPPFYLVSNTQTENDFGIHLMPDIYDLSVSGHSVIPPRPGFDWNFLLQYTNEGSTAQNAAVSVVLDSSIEFISADPEPSVILGDSLFWALDELNIFESRSINITTTVPVDAIVGSTVVNAIRIYSTNSEETPEDNYAFMKETVVSSFDPNAKAVNPPNGLTEEEIAAGEDLSYTIYFQNTGTYLAENVRITDLLDTAHYLPSLRLISASHEVTRFKLNPGGLLEIEFDNIMLPDSTNNEPESHGFVTFTIQRNKNFNAEVPVKNIAAIYFDFNDPIFTNEVRFTIPDSLQTTVLEEVQRTESNSLSIFPNPTFDSFEISIADLKYQRGLLQVLNISGQIIYEKESTDFSNPVSISTESFPAGIYLVRVTTVDHEWFGKVVVLH